MAKKRKGIDYHKMRCPYCGGHVCLREPDEIYQKELSDVKLYVCEHYPECNTYVRTHAGTNIPIGTMANEELRSLRRTAHYYFNRLYLSGLMSRNEAYLWLSEQLSAPLSEAHIGKLGEYYCRQVIEKSKKMLEEYTRKGKIKGKVYSIHENDRGTEGEGRNKYGTGRKSNCG